MQPVSSKKYFLLACLIAFVVLIIAVAGKVMLGHGGRNMVLYNQKYGYGVAPSTPQTAPEMSSYGEGSFGRGADSKIAIDSTGQTADLIAPGVPVPIPPRDSTPVAGADRKIIKNGNVSVVVKDVDQASKAIENKAKELGGYLSATNINSSGNNTKSGYVSARIPVDKVNDFLAFLRSSSVKVSSENINSDDVTSQYIDLQAKITNLEATATQYRDLLKRAVKVEEVLQVQRELNNVQTEIDSYKGQLKYLEGNASLSNITVNLAVDEGELPIAPENKWEPGNVFKASIRGLTTLAQNLSYAVIMLAVYAVVWIPVTIGLILLYKFLRKRIQ